MIIVQESANTKPAPKPYRERKDIVILVLQYEGDCPDDILEIHEQAESQYSGIVSVRASFGREYGSKNTGLGAGLGSAPRRYEPPISQQNA